MVVRRSVVVANFFQGPERVFLSRSQKFKGPTALVDGREGELLRRRRMTTPPVELKALGQFLKRAEELDKAAQPEAKIVAFYCRQMG